MTDIRDTSERRSGTDPNTPIEDREDDTRSDLEQVVQARSDAIERGEGGAEPETFTETGMADGVGGTGGVTRNQDDDAQ